MPGVNVIELTDGQIRGFVGTAGRGLFAVKSIERRESGRGGFGSIICAVTPTFPFSQNTPRDIVYETDELVVYSNGDVYNDITHRSRYLDGPDFVLELSGNGRIYCNGEEKDVIFNGKAWRDLLTEHSMLPEYMALQLAAEQFLAVVRSINAEDPANDVDKVLHSWYPLDEAMNAYEKQRSF